MALTVTWNGTSYSIPQSGERGWASLTTFLQALANGAQSTGKQIIGRRTATATPVTVTATTDSYIGVNVSGAAATVNLPAGVNGQVFIIADESDAANTYNITVNPNGANTINSTTSFVMSRNSQAIVLIFSGSDWVVLANGSPSNPIVTATDSAEIDFTVSSAGALTASLIAGSVARTKLASGTASHVVINDGSGVMSSEAQLASTRGGTGINNAGTLTYGASNITLTTSGATSLTVPTSGTVATLAGTENLSNKSFTNATIITAANELRFNNSGNTNYTGLKGGAAASSGTFILPVSDGTASQAMVTDGARQLGWATVATTVGVVAANDSNVTFTNSDNRTQICLPTAARTYTLPTTSIVAGDTWNFYNQSAFLITVNASGGTTEGYVYPYSSTTFVCLSSTPTTNAHWNHYYHTAAEWVAYTPTIGAGFGTATGVTGMYRVVGDTLSIRVIFTTGTIAASLATVTVPTAFTIASSKLVVSATSGNPGAIVGIAHDYNASANRYLNVVVNTGTSTSLLYFGGLWSGNGSAYDTPQQGISIAASSVQFQLTAEVPIV